MGAPLKMGDGVSVWPMTTPPVILTPTPNQAINILLGLTLTTAPYVASLGDQTATDWEIRTAANGGGSVAWSSMNNLLALLIILIPGLILPAGQTLYVRARFRSEYDISEWSADVRITT